MYLKTSNPYNFKYLITGISGEGIKEVYLPDKPPDEDILFRKEQKWVRPELPKHIKKAIKVMYDKYNTDSKNYDPTYISPYSYEIRIWEDQQWERSENGCWFWNNGVATYITGFYYWYLTEWQTYFGYPTYRETDKEITYFIKFCEDDPNCYGMLLNTIRRYGKSALMGAWLIYRTGRNYNWFGGAQGESDKKIKKFWDVHLIRPFRKLMPYTKPKYDISSKLTEDIKFQREVVKGKEQEVVDMDDHDINDDSVGDEDIGLESYLDHRASGEGEYDQAVLHSYVMEEPGKCHPAGTLVRMFDGSLKKVEDVKVGDRLMGDDSKARIVKEKGFGKGKIYKIIPNKKADPWYVNEYHILSCKVLDHFRFPGYRKGDVLNIELRDYLKLSDDKKKNLVCYRVGVEYKEKEHNIDPYFLGLWLGDGSKHGPEITSIEPEIVSWLNSKYTVTKKKCPNRAQSYYIKDGVVGLLRNKNLLLNKHIPDEYLIDSRSNRLKLLAGIIDTDGHRDSRISRPNQRAYEVIQKDKQLSYQIRELCLSLGFYASLKCKVATMKRSDGSIYKCEVYRINIYGRNLYEIPCKVKRKKMPKNITTYNSKDPSIYGFKVEYDRDDYYYGFNISGNRLYLLSDYTVTHNTLVANVSLRWDTVKPCLRRGIFIRGKAFFGTTVEYMDVMDKGGRAYQKLFYESDYDKRDELNQTVSGLYAAFLPGDCALEGYFDDWGHPLRDRARIHITLERKSKKNKPRDYSNLIRKYALNIAEIFWVNAERCIFNADILQRRKLVIDSSTTPFFSKFDLRWENGKRFTKLLISHNPENGWLKASWMFPGNAYTELANKVRKNSDGSYSPLNESIFTAGLDTVDHRVQIEQRVGQGEDEFITSRRSKPVLSVKRRYDSSIDVITPEESALGFGEAGSPGILTQQLLEHRRDSEYQYKTGISIAYMDIRTSDPLVNYERTLMVCWLFGMSANVESSKPGYINYCFEHKCHDFVKNKYIPESNTKSISPESGTPASNMTINEYCECLMWEIEYFYHCEPFVDFINDHLIFDPAKTKIHDYTVSRGWCSLGEKIRPKVVSLPVLDVTDILPTFRNGQLVRK